jgi:cysteine synthase A
VTANFERAQLDGAIRVTD